MRVAVLDNGSRRHPAVAIVAEPLADVDGDPDAEPDADGDDYLDPVAGHGTFIGGLIARIAPGCGLLIDSASLTAYGDGDEFDHRRRHRQARRPARSRRTSSTSPSAATPSTTRPPSACATPSSRPWPKGIVVVASAGNDGVSRRAYPAAFDGVVSVAALGHDGPAPFSNWGSWVRACAPGVDMVSTFYNGNWAEERKKYGVDPDVFTGWAHLVGHLVRRAGGGRRAGPHA